MSGARRKDRTSLHQEALPKKRASSLPRLRNECLPRDHSEVPKAQNRRAQSIRHSLTRAAIGPRSNGNAVRRLHISRHSAMCRGAVRRPPQSRTGTGPIRARLNVRVAVAFPMPPFSPMRYDAAEKGRHVPAHIGIGPFIDRQARQVVCGQNSAATPCLQPFSRITAQRRSVMSTISSRSRVTTVHISIGNPLLLRLVQASGLQCK